MHLSPMPAPFTPLPLYARNLPEKICAVSRDRPPLSAHPHWEFNLSIPSIARLTNQAEGNQAEGNQAKASQVEERITEWDFKGLRISTH